MKNLTLIFSLAIISVVLFSVQSCSKDEFSNQPYDPDNKPSKGLITLQVVVEELPSKIELSIGNGSGYNWPHTDKFLSYPPIDMGSVNSDKSIISDTPSDIEIDWGDGSVTHMASHTYERRGTHTVTIKDSGIKIFSCMYSYANIISIDVSKCSNIEALVLSPEVKSLNVTRNPHLISLAWSPAESASLNVGNNSKLEHLAVGANVQISDVSKNPMLQRLEYTSSASGLDLSSNPLLAYLDASGQFSALDLSKCPDLQYLLCGSHNLTDLKIETCKKLQHLKINNSQLEELELDGYPQLCWFDAPQCNFKKLSIKNSFNKYDELVTYIRCAGGIDGFDYSKSDITSLEIVNCPALQWIEAYHGRLTSVKIEDCASLDRILVGGNQLSSISLSGTDNYTYLNVVSNLFDDSGLNVIYNLLPTYSYPPTGTQPQILIAENNGTGNTSIATSKGWEVVVK